MLQNWLWQSLLPLLQLLLSLRVAGAISNCSDANSTVAVTVQLNRTHILRTWQPDGDCLWWENRRSETDQFPAAVRSGPRWLVMQLRQPMMLDRVSVRGWDGQWRAAAPVGSPVSAVGASSLPLELQLEDPCRASWEAFGSSDRWRPLGGAGDHPAIRFIQINSSSSAGLNWSRIDLTGRSPLLSLAVRNDWHCAFVDPSAMWDGWEACFSVTSCLNGPLSCTFELQSGSSIAIKQLNGIQMRPAEFQFKANLSLHGATLTCQLRDRPAVRTEETIGIVVPPASLSVSVSPVWVSGRSVTVSVTSTLAYPAQQHSCRIVSGNSTWHLNISENVRTVIWNATRVLVSDRSQFRFNVSAAMLNGTVNCSSKRKDPAVMEDHVALHGNASHISPISEPCVTAIDLSQSRQGIVRVTSLKCSVWSVSHSCWVQGADGAAFEPLLRLSQDDFDSTHRLGVHEGIDEQNWLVRCSVNQSGLAYPDVEIRPEAPKTGPAGPSGYRWAFGIILLLIFVASGVAVSSKLTRLLTRSETASSLYQSYQDGFGSGNLGSQQFTVSTVASCGLQRQQRQPSTPSFVTVTSLFVEDSDSVATDEEELFTQAAGHYELDGCTFVHYLQCTAA